MSIASLPMYDVVPLQETTDAWWTAIAGALRRHGFADVPDRLDRDGRFGDRFAHWASPDLLLSQTCGYPLTHDFAAHLRLIATPCYSVPHCVGSDYRSVIVVKEDNPATTIEDLRGGRVAINSYDSHSGHNALRALVAPHARDGRFFSEVVPTGAHLLSLGAVARGEVDVCSTDCVTHGLTSRFLPEVVAGTRMLTLTKRAPALPYVTHIGRSDEEVERMREALQDVVQDPALAAVRARMMIAGFEVLPRSDYDRIDTMEREAADAGYPDLA